jgi:hypothetical protein
MYQLFNERPVNSGGGFDLPEFRRLRDGLRQSIYRITSYRQENTTGLDGSHLLVRLLQNLNISLHLDVEIYVDKVNDVAYGTANALKLTSPLLTGQIHREGVFYRKLRDSHGIKEVIIASTDDFDIQDFKKNWRRYDPIRVISHPLTDLWMTVPDGRITQAADGFAVISINIPMLAAQYRMWRHERRDIERSESPRTVGQFLMEVPLPNMLYTHVDIALFNRMMALYFDLPLSNGSNRHPFALPDYHMHVDQALNTFIGKVVPKKLNFDNLISTFLTASHDDYHEILKFPDLSFARQIQWAVLIARLPLLCFLLAQNRDYPGANNNRYLAQIRFFFQMNDYGKYLRSSVDAQSYRDLMTLVERGVLPYL